TLHGFGLRAEADLRERKARLRRTAPWRDREGQRRVRKVLALSRVTLGADVAVTSVVLQRARELFPQAQRVLLAPAKAQELFGGDSSLAIRSVPYRSGTLLERLDGWREVLTAVQEELRGLSPPEYLVLDPDSRYLQLGLLPALREESRYYFFESRRAGGEGPQPLSLLAGEWMNQMFGGDATPRPAVSLRGQDADSGRRLRRRLRAGGAKRIVAVSFGVGGNPGKRLPDPFEAELVARLLQSGETVVLDQGAGEEEGERARRLAGAIERHGWKVTNLRAEALGEDLSPLSGALLTWQGGIGSWAGLINASDEYIGYDSASQHIAAALGIPTISIFSAGTTERFRQRWRPVGAGAVRVIVEPERTRGDSVQKTLAETMRAHQEFQTTTGR
ncbi:MAG TPA: glycosyltransferase family 9 protein, partial [Terriglobia bacterium]|nr:glycosyltransferase family 9 protein [Terriglobia bacterium]